MVIELGTPTANIAKKAFYGGTGTLAHLELITIWSASHSNEQ